jgi:ppGpp synthetase/RelA/SpoT-type nucleotidyltranferase
MTDSTTMQCPCGAGKSKSKFRTTTTRSTTTTTTTTRRSTISATALAVLVACRTTTPVSSFAPSTSTMAPVDNLTSRNFRHIDDSGDFSVPTKFSSYLEDQYSETQEQLQHEQEIGPQVPEHDADDCTTCSIDTNFCMSSAPLSYFSVNEQMPTWLRPCGSLAETKLSNLREHMLASYLSPLEAEKVISAIREASSGDLNKMAGAADFCFLLVDTMEMGVSTLIAAAFHYCECFVARQKNALFPPSSFTADYWYNTAHLEQKERRIKFGDDSDKITKDAARLKRTEMLAGQSLRSKPSEKDSENMRKMLLSETKDWRALAIRSAGCLYRLRGIYEARETSEGDVVSPSDIRVAHEALDIFAPLASRLGMHRLKNEIEGAAFRVLYRRQFEKVTALTLETTPCDSEDGCSTLNEGMTVILSRVTDEVKNLLKKDPCFQRYADSVKVTARIKEPYSLWKKMLRTKGEQVLDVPDALALRVVLEGKKICNEDAEVTSARERALCYYALKKCTNTFKPLKDGRFKDYIYNPKPNGYQSLHYTASTDFDGQQWPFEIQIRSSEMHKVAEFGLAAHWDYKEQGRTNASQEGKKTATPHYAFNLDQSSDAYLRSVQDWHWNQIQGQSHRRSSWGTDTSSKENFPKEASFSGTSTKDQERSERVRARDERLAPYLKALMADQSNLTREQVFIFLQSQENAVTLALPAGSCVLDAIRESERTFGVTSDRNIEKAVEHNGSLASVTRKLSNGDILTIPFNVANVSSS